MNRISRQLKKEADRLLPDEKLKNDITKRLFPESTRERVKTPARRGFAFALSAVVCVLVIAIALAVIFSLPTNPDQPPITAGTVSDTLVLIDINPSFEIIADKDGNVKSVTGVNSDARIVLLGKNYVGSSVYDVCTDIINTAIKLGYVNNKHGQVNISAYNDDAAIGKEYVAQLMNNVGELVASSGGTVVATDGENAKQKLIDEIIAAYGNTAGLDEKTVLELHRLLNQYDVTKEKELDELEEIWEEELEKAGLDDDEMEDAIDRWKEEYLKPLGEELEEELEYYIDIFKLQLMLDGSSEKEAEAAADDEEYRLTEIGRQDRKALREFIDAWWIELDEQFRETLRTILQSKGYDQTETIAFEERVFNALSAIDDEDCKEIRAELVEGYMESILDPDEGYEYWEEFLEELFEDD